MASADFTRSLDRVREIDIMVTGRKSKRRITVPVWFARDADSLYLLPVSGSDTQWYRNVRKDPAIEMRAGRARASAEVRPLTRRRDVEHVIELFRARYGAGDVKRYYRKLNVALAVTLTNRASAV